MKKKLIMMLFAVLILTFASSQITASSLIGNESSPTVNETISEDSQTFNETETNYPQDEVVNPSKEIERESNSSVQKKETAKPFVERSLPNTLNFSVSMSHTRTGVNEHYNGERVSLEFTFSGETIPANEQYQITGFFDEKPIASLSTWAFLMNMDESITPIFSSGSQIGNAQYNATNKSIDVMFTQAMTPADLSTLTIEGNIAIKENNTPASQTMDFELSDGATSISTSAVIPTCDKGFKVVPKFSRTTNVQQYSNVNVELAWTAESGIGKDDYFLVELPFLSEPGLGMGLTFQEANGKTVAIQDANATYGEAVYHYLGSNKYSTSTIAFNFNQSGSNQLNISGKVTLEGQYYLWTDTTITVLPNSKTFTVYINGEKYDIEVGIGTPNNETKKDSLYKSSRVGSDISNDPVASAKGFYRFGWTVTINRNNLPYFVPPAGGVLHNASVKDSVVGPGHYIDRASITISCLKDFTLLGEPLYKSAHDWTGGKYPNTSATSITLNQFIQYYGSDSVEIEPYTDNGNTNPNKMKGFKINFKDLDGVAMEVIYTSYIEDGSTTEIPSFKDYFFQSMMNDKKLSDKYFNKATLFSDEILKSQVTSEMSTTNMTSSMKSGNINLRIKKVDEQGNPQAGVKFKLYWLGGNGPEVATDVNGYAEFTSMGADFYKLVETSPKDDYEALEEIVFQIPPQVSQGHLNNYMDLSDPIFRSSGGISDLNTVNESNAFVNEVTNYPKNSQCKVKILKISAETGDPLAGAGFTLFDENKVQIGTEIITGSTGEAEFLISSGIYYIKETIAPVGYVIDPNFHLVEVTNQDEEIIITMKNSTTPDVIEKPGIKIEPKKPIELVKPSMAVSAASEINTKDSSQTTNQMLLMLLSGAFLFYCYTIKKSHE